MSWWSGISGRSRDGRSGSIHSDHAPTSTPQNHTRTQKRLIVLQRSAYLVLRVLLADRELDHRDSGEDLEPGGAGELVDGLEPGGHLAVG